MALEFKAGTALKVTINRHINRASAKKTIERLFMKDDAIAGPIEARSANHKRKPKRRGGRIWTKWPNKVHPELVKGVTATVKATPQALKDLASVEDFVTISG